MSKSTATLLVSPEAGADLSVNRPISYMGSKLRSIHSIIEVRNQWASTPLRVLDPFVGSSVVAQAFARNGDSVVCSDAMKMCTDMANATICGKPWLVERLRAHADEINSARAVSGANFFDSYVEIERILVNQGDAATLISFSTTVPQIWRPSGASRELKELFAQLHRLQGKRVERTMPVFAAYYGATYFGLYQALEIDRIWQSIMGLAANTRVDSWIIAALLTSLYAAASSCTFTAGKHFAQPYLNSVERTNDYALGRVLVDRQIDVADKFKSSLEALIAGVEQSPRNHEVVTQYFEAWTPEAMKTAGINLIYADPPYTAQQYSRFYHVLETLAQGCVPTLQVFRGSTTRGLYPVSRFKSRFCSKRTAKPAFEDLLNLAVNSDAAVLLSYSFASTSTGNARMIQMDELMSLTAVKKGRLVPHVYRLPHQYRSLVASERDSSEDWEALILFAPHASALLR